MNEQSTWIRHLVGAGGTERGTDDALNNIWVVNIEHPGSEVKKALRIRSAIALQGLRREIPHILVRGCQQPHDRERVQIVALDAVQDSGPVPDQLFQIAHESAASTMTDPFAP